MDHNPSPLYGHDPANSPLIEANSFFSSPSPSPRPRIPQKFLGLDQGINLLNAHFFAEGGLGDPLNTHAAIHLTAAPGFDGASAPLQRLFLTDLVKSTRSWVERHTGKECHWIWCLENDDRKRLHLHLHLPLSRVYHDNFREFLKTRRDLNGPCFRAPVHLSGGEDNPTPYQLESKRRYLLKSLKPDGLAPDGRTAFLPLRVITEPGTVEGCRCRISNSLNKKARAAAGWREITDLAELDAMLPVKPGVNWWERFRRGEQRKATEAGHA